MARVLTRKGAAHCMLGDLQNAVDDFSLVRRKEALE